MQEQDKLYGKGAAHCECKTVRHRVGQKEYIYVLSLYFHLFVFICVHTQAYEASAPV